VSPCRRAITVGDHDGRSLQAAARSADHLHDMGRPADMPLDENALRDAHATLTRILGAIEEYVYTGEFLPDDRYRIVFAGPCREQFLGLSIEEARSAVWRYYVHPDDIDLFDGAHAAAHDSGRLDVDYRLVGADGVVRWVRDRGRLRVEDGRRFLDGSILDVTEIHSTQEQLQAARAEADRLAHVDDLTGAANRRSLARLLAGGGTQALGVLSIDLDRFKQVNDLFGHAAGDAVLIAVAQRLRESVRADDAVLRMGGEEFLVLIRGVDDEPALVEIAESIRRRVQDEPILAGGDALPITVSVGAAVAQCETADLEAVLLDADRALYEAKRAGRNRVHLAVADVASAPRERGALEDTEALRIARAVAVTAGAAEGVDQDHLEAVAALAAQVAVRMGLTAPQIMRCRLAGLVHDIGKLRVPSTVVNRPAALEPEDWVPMRAHSEHGEALLNEIPELRLLARIVRHHHERFDGSGYPDGLAGHAIPVESRVLAAVDAWSAMRSDRPYRSSLDEAAAIHELQRVAGSQLDPGVVRPLLAVLGRGAAPSAQAA
jgi:diguanylate cyclase (GGDEF)-like protein/PAS domain S-box-containing protein